MPPRPPAPDPDTPPTPDAPDAPDTFDAWLDALFAAPPAPAPSDPTASPQEAAARELRVLAAQTDAIALPAVSWKEILVTSQPAATAPTTAPASTPSAPTPLRRPPSRLVPALNRVVSIAAILAILVAGVATAWVSRDRLGFGDDNQPTLQLAASPASTVTCTTRTLTHDEADRIAADYREPTLGDYTVTDSPVPEGDALAAIATYRAICPDGDPGTDQTLWSYSTQTDRLVAINYLSSSPGWFADHLQHYRDMLEPLSRMLTPLPPTSYIVDRDDPAIGPFMYNSNSAGYRAILPSRFIQLADGRIGVPIVNADTGGASPNTDYSALSIGFIIFANVDGRWLIDEGFLLCPGNCAPAETRLDAQIANSRRIASVIGSPVASPAASPASSPISSPVSTVTCTISTVSQEEADRLVAAYRAQPQRTLADYTPSDTPVSQADAQTAIAVLSATLNCSGGDPNTNRLLWKYSTYVDDYFAGVYLTTDPVWMAEYYTRWKTDLEPMSHLLAPLPPEDYIVDSNDPSVQPYIISSANLGTYAILPNRFVALPGDRIGVPLLLAIPGGAAAYNGYLSTLPVPFVTFRKVDGTWLLEDMVGLCPEDCSQAEARLEVYIANYRRLATVIGSPVASPAASPEASPEATPES